MYICLCTCAPFILRTSFEFHWKSSEKPSKQQVTHVTEAHRNTHTHKHTQHSHKICKKLYFFQAHANEMHNVPQNLCHANCDLRTSSSSNSNNNNNSQKRRWEWGKQGKQNCNLHNKSESIQATTDRQSNEWTNRQAGSCAMKNNNNVKCQLPTRQKYGKQLPSALANRNSYIK